MSENIINQIILGQFRVDAFVASGGMGAVYRVWDLKRNVPLAMKVLHAELAEDPSVFKRFKREANALKKLAHPNIVPFYGLYQTLDFSFLLEDFIDGPTLKEILRQRKGKPLPIGEALIYLKALCAALGYAHANGVVHCDVKPGNVLVDRGGRIYLTDFGVARHAESTTTTLGVAGTPAYMTPEQILGQPVTPATDVYSLGVVLFELLTGQRPFRGTEQGTDKMGPTANERIRYGHLHRPPPDPRSLNMAIPPGVAKVILKALSKGPVDRYRSALDFFGAVCSAAEVQVGDVVSQTTLADVIPPKRDYSNGSVVITPKASRKDDKNLQPRLARKNMLVLLGSFGMVTIIAAIFLTIVAGIFFILRGAGPDFPPDQGLIPTQPSLSTHTPPPSPRPKATSQPPSPTPYVPPAQPPTSQGPMLYLNKNSFCRRGPGTEYIDVTSFPAGESFPIIGMDSDGWWFVKLDVPVAGSDRKACWIYGEGNTPEGDVSLVVNREDFEVPRGWLP